MRLPNFFKQGFLHHDALDTGRKIKMKPCIFKGRLDGLVITRGQVFGETNQTYLTSSNKGD